MTNKIIASLLITCFFIGAYAQTIVDNNNDFSFKVFQEVSKSDTNNVFISPVSISTALAMTYQGAKGRTAKEMRNTLRFTRNKKETHKQFTQVLKDFQAEQADIFKIVNAVFTQEKYDIRQTFIDALKDYSALIKQADFINDEHREKARNEINNWVLENTNYKIKELIDKTSIDRDTRLVLLNAIHFLADWKYEFPKKKTRQMLFQGTNRQYIASFMHQKEKLNFYEDSLLKFIELPYTNDKASMFILLPQEDYKIDNFIQDLSYEKFKNILNLAKEEKVDVLMPKFKIEAKYKLKENLKNMGMVQAFSKKANFKGINGRSDLLIDDVIHQSFIKVDEKGTEAAAATAVVVRQKSSMRTKHINLNRPFVFVIVEKSKNSILFIGKLMKPQE